MPASEEDIGRNERFVLADNSPRYFDYKLGYRAENLADARKATGITDPKINPFTASEGRIKAIQMLMDRYGENRKPILDDMRDFKMFIWQQKFLQPLEEVSNMEENIAERVKKLAKYYDGSIDMANKLMARQEELAVFGNVGAIEVDWKKYGFSVDGEILTVIRDGDGQQLIEQLQNEKLNLAARYQVSCPPKFEPVYKVQFLTKRGRFYDWHEEAA